MTPKTLVAIAWTSWGLLVLLTIYMLIKVSTERSRSPEASRGLGVMAVTFCLLLLMGAGFALLYFSRKASSGGVLAIAILLGYPIVMLVVSPAIGGLKRWSFEREIAKNGAFRDPALQALAGAVDANDAAALARLLGHGPAPAGTDRAGNDLLGYALHRVSDAQAGAAVVRALLDAGADPRTARMEGRSDILNLVVVGRSEETAEVVRLLLARGADPNAVDPVTAETPLRRVYDRPDVARALVDAGADLDRIQPDGCNALVHFVSTRQWETALLLVERGSRLDVVNQHGLSVDYYLKDWKDSVFGEHPEGWDRLRAAIAKRRGANP